MMESIALKKFQVNVEKINGDNMDEKPLTEEQKQKLKKLQRGTALRMAGLSLKFGLSLFLANFVVSIINVFYVQNETFAFIGSLMSAFMIFRSFRLSFAQEHDRVKEEIKKILEK